MSTLLLESSPYYLPLCLLISIGVAWFLYTAKVPWGRQTNRLLFVLRSALFFLLLLLLLSPILRRVNNLTEKPVLVLLEDSSGSVIQVVDSAVLTSLRDAKTDLTGRLVDRGYQVESRTLGPQGAASDFNKAFRSIASDFEGKRVAGVVFATDGIYNAGVSPLYTAHNFPIHTVGLGDTTLRTDLVIRNVVHNKVAYQGNRFPAHVEISATGFLGKNINIGVYHKGQKMDEKTVVVESENLVAVHFQIPAGEKGIQRYEIVLKSEPGEWSRQNNRSTFFVEVVDGKKKILAVASAPHPDIKAIRAVVEQNANYEFQLFVPSLGDQNFREAVKDADLVVAFQVPDTRGVSKALFLQVVESKVPMLLVLGQQTDWRELERLGLLKVEAPHRQYDEVVPSINSSFNQFILSPDVATVFNSFPPATVPFAKFQWTPTSVPILYQKVGSLVTDRPLLSVDTEGDRKVGIMLGEGMWRWRMHEYSRNESTEAFDEVMGKLIQFLTTTDDRRRFRCYPIQQQFSTAEPSVFETQVYNEIFEPIFGQAVDIELINEAGQRSQYQYTTSAANSRYIIGLLPEGVYRYRAVCHTCADEEVRGEFLVVEQQVELQNLTADFNLLRKLSAQTGGEFYELSDFDKLAEKLLADEPVSSIHTEEKFDPLVSLTWFFLVLLIIVSGEWFLRKYHGSY